MSEIENSQNIYISLCQIQTRDPHLELSFNPMIDPSDMLCKLYL